MAENLAQTPVTETEKRSLHSKIRIDDIVDVLHSGCSIRKTDKLNRNLPVQHAMLHQQIGRLLNRNFRIRALASLPIS